MIIVSPNFVKSPLVSVVIPNYNRCKTVGETIDSILAQDCTFDFEIIIGDDCSTDNAREVLTTYQKRYPKQIKLLFHEQNIGLGANWATCVKACKGEFICNCDNDDYWHNPQKLQLQVEYMREHPDCGMVITHHRTHNRKTGKIEECKAYIKRDMPLQQALFKGHTAFCNATIMYRKSLIDAHLNLDDFIAHQFTLQDWNTWIILSAYSPMDIIDVSTATFGIETISITRPESYESLISRFNKELDCYKYVCGLFPKELIFNQADWDSHVNNLLFSMAFRKGDFARAKEYGANRTNKTGIKYLCSQNRVLFYLFCWSKKLLHSSN